MKNKVPETIAEKSAHFDALLAWFDSDEFDIEQAIDKFREAEKLACELERDLLEMKNSITVIQETFNT